jgi:hypothetical protein
VEDEKASIRDTLSAYILVNSGCLIEEQRKARWEDNAEIQKGR